MSGLDCLREELIRHGYTKVQVESAIVPAVLDIVANSGKRYTDIQAAEVRETRRLKKLKDEIAAAERIKRQTVLYREELIERERRVEKKAEDIVGYIDKFYAALKECETPEGRDTMRRAQMFVNTVEIDTKYDNTAFIIGLSAILTNGAVAAIDELKKINPKIIKKPSVEPRDRDDGKDE